MEPTKMPTSEQEPGLSYGSIESQLNFLKGKVLTVVDASYEASEQREAVKALVHMQFREQLDWMYELSYGHPKIANAGTQRSDTLSN